MGWLCGWQCGREGERRFYPYGWQLVRVPQPRGHVALLAQPGCRAGRLCAC